MKIYPRPALLIEHPSYPPEARSQARWWYNEGIKAHLQPGVGYPIEMFERAIQ